MSIALVRRPSPRLAEGIVSHIERTPVDVELAVHQWERYVETVRSEGWTIVEVAPVDDCPDGVFIEDAVVMFDRLAVLTHPGSELRRPEVATAEAAVHGLGLAIARIHEPGTLDGGDVLKVGTTAYVGHGGRTNAEGIAQLRAILEPRGWTVIAVPVTKVLHLKSAVTALPDGTVIGWPDAVDDASVFDRYLAVAEEGGAHVVLLGGKRILMSADAPASAARFRELGYEPIEVDISEFVKLEGCVTCLSVRVRLPEDDPAA